MKYVIKSNDGYYLCKPGYRLSYDDGSFSTFDIYEAQQFSSKEGGEHSFFSSGRRFSRENARVIAVKLVECPINIAVATIILGDVGSKLLSGVPANYPTDFATTY